MPLYEGECPQCPDRFEDIMPVREYEEKGLICPECGAKSRNVLSPTPTVGPMPSKPMRIDQIGRTFSSQAEMRRYFKQHPDRVVVDPKDSAFRDHRDLAREKADKKAKFLGFRDFEDRTQKTKSENRKKEKIARGEGKIYKIA